MDSNPENRKMEIEQETLKNLNITRKWTMFLSIIGFIFLGFFIVMGVIAGTFLSAFNTGETSLGIPEVLIGAIFLILAVVYFFSLHFLFRFSKHISKVISTCDNKELPIALKNLKSYFVFFGIMVIIILIFYVLILVVPGVSMAFLKSL
jgi:hypothetical protein